MDSIKLNSVIGFQVLNRNERRIVYDDMMQRFRDVFGELPINSGYMINYRINGQWRTRPLTTEIWKRLLDSIDKDDFVYGKEIFETGMIDPSDALEIELYKLIHFDLITKENYHHILSYNQCFRLIC